MTLTEFFNLSILDLEKFFKGYKFRDFYNVGRVIRSNKKLATLLGLTGFYKYGRKARLGKKSNPWCFNSIEHWWNGLYYTIEFSSPYQDLAIFISRDDFGVVSGFGRRGDESLYPPCPDIDKTKRLRDFLIFDGSDSERIR